MKTISNNIGKKSFLFISLALMTTVLLVVAIPINWFEAAEVTGVVVQTESGIVKAIVDLGVLSSATGFSASGNASLTIAEAEGLKIAEFVMGFPYYTPEDGYVYESYLTMRFYSLSVDLTIGENVWSIPIVVDGSYPWDQWYYGWDEYPWSYRSYAYWTEHTLPQGNYTATFTIYGKTGLLRENRAVNMMFYFELAPTS